MTEPKKICLNCEHRIRLTEYCTATFKMVDSDQEACEKYKEAKSK